MAVIVLIVIVFLNKLKNGNGGRNLRDHLVHELKTILLHMGQISLKKGSDQTRVNHLVSYKAICVIYVSCPIVSVISTLLEMPVEIAAQISQAGIMSCHAHEFSPYTTTLKFRKCYIIFIIPCHKRCNYATFFSVLNGS